MEDSGEEDNKLDEKEAVDYSLVLSEIHHRVLNSQNEFPEGAYFDIVNETEDIFIENGYTKGISGVIYSVEAHTYLLGKFGSYQHLMMSGYKSLFNMGMYVKAFSPDEVELKKLDSEKSKLLRRIKRLMAKDPETLTQSEITTIQNAENMNETYNSKYESYYISDSHHKINYDSENTKKQKRFSFYFNWYLSTLNSYEIRPFLEFHFNNSFANDLKNFKSFIKFTIAEDRNEIIPEFSREVAFEEVDKFRIYEIEANPLSGLTQNQVVLLVYFYLESMGVEKSLIDKSSVARFIHLLVGKPLTKLQNSNIYAKVKKYPNFVEDKYLKDDLIIVKKILDDFGLSTASQLVIVEISRCS
jgi:hypothetical protein